MGFSLKSWILGRKFAECEPKEETKDDTPRETAREKILIVGAGMLGISSAYYLAKDGRYDVTVIDKDNPIKGATSQNGNTITFIPYPAWTTMSVKTILKDALTNSSKPLFYFKLSLLFDSHFRFWCRKYFQHRNADAIKQSNAALARMTTFSISLFDKFINDVTGNNPDSVEYHEEVLNAVYKGLSEKEIQDKVELVEYMKQFEKGLRMISPKRFDAEFAYEIPVRCFNSAKFVEYMQKDLAQKHGVNFIHGEVKAANFSEGNIKSLEYQTPNSEVQTLKDFDKYVVCTGIESVEFGQLLGLRVPLMGFKGHSLNIHVKDRETTPDSTYIYMPETICISRVGYKTGGLVRVTGFADVDGNNLNTIPWRKEMLVDLAKKFVSAEDYDEEKASHWVGLRPVCADDVPLIGKSSVFGNLYWNTGHGSRGITQSVGSAVLLNSLITGEEVPENLVAKDYDPSRFNI